MSKNIKWPGSRRKPLKKLDPDKTIKGNPRVSLGFPWRGFCRIWLGFAKFGPGFDPLGPAAAIE
jgi:hypothetical protein